MSLYNDLYSVLTPYANKIKQNEDNVRLALSLEGGGAPTVVSSTSAMTDTTQIYVLSTDGNWYYHNGSAWVAGGTYGALSTDTTLTQANVPADAKAAGDAISNISEELYSTNVLSGNYFDMSGGEYSSVIPDSDVIVGNRNMIKPTENGSTAGGLTWVFNDDGTVTVSGTATRSQTINIAKGVNYLPNGTYTLSGRSEGDTWTGIALYADAYSSSNVRTRLATDRGNGGTGTLADGYDHVDIYTSVANGTAFNAPITIKPQLERGSVVTEYVKCDNHIVSAGTNIHVNNDMRIFNKDSFALEAKSPIVPKIVDELGDTQDTLETVTEDVDTLEIDVEDVKDSIAEINRLIYNPYPQNDVDPAQMITITDGGDKLPLSEMIVTVPYSATAKNKIRVAVSSKNLFNADDVITKNHVTKNPDGSITTPLSTSIFSGLYGEGTAIPSEDLDRVLFLPAGTYYVFDRTNLKVRAVDASTGAASIVTIRSNNTFVLANDTLIDFMLAGTKSNLMVSLAPQSEYNSNAGKTYVIPFTDLEGNSFAVYGGTVDPINGIVTELYDASGNVLAEPIAHNIPKVEVKTILGFNHIWTDGQSITVKYRADIKEYTDQRNKSELLEKYNIDASVFGNVRNELFMDAGTNMIATAHRGLSRNAPENTLIAYKMARQAGFICAETDVDWTSDDVPVLLHDGTINRTARNADGSELSETISIRDITYAQSQEYDFGIWFSSEFAGTKIPTFMQFMRTCKNLGLHPTIELKNKTQEFEKTLRLVQIVIANGMINRVRWTTNFGNLILDILSIHQGANVILVSSVLNDERKAWIEEIKTKYPAVNLTISCGIDYVTSEDYVYIKERNIPMDMWTIDNPALIRNLDPYITGVTSNILNAATVLREAELQ